MNRLLKNVLLLCVFLFGWGIAIGHVSAQQEFIMGGFDPKEWKIGHQTKDQNQIIVEFVPDGAPTPALVNALAEILIIGSPATPAAPVFTVAPTITGTASQGSTLSAHTGAFTGSPTPVSGFQWVRCNVGGVVIGDISGAVGDTYILGAGDVGHTIRVRQTAANSAGSASSSSAQTAVISA